MHMKDIRNILCLLLLWVSCSQPHLSYSVSDKNVKEIKGEVWQKTDFLYNDLRITDSYSIFLSYNENEGDTLLRIYDKNAPLNLAGYGRKEGGGFSSYEFAKSNTREVSEEDEVWIVKNKASLQRIKCREGEVSYAEKIQIPHYMGRNSAYNFTKEAVYVVPSHENINKAFCFYLNSERNPITVKMYGATDTSYSKTPYAFLPNLIVNEDKRSVVCAYRFFNKVQFFDGEGEIVKDVTYGSSDIKPIINDEGAISYLETRKCFIDICGTADYVYCLYDGSADFDAMSKIIVFDWNGNYVKTLQTDRFVKKIAVDPSAPSLLAIGVSPSGEGEILHYVLP